MGTARLIRDIASLLPYTTSPAAWERRLAWATHVADVRFVSASMSATRLVDVASSSAQKLQDPKISNAERKEVKKVVERTLRKIAPFERTQGNVLLGLARTMIDAIGALYLGRTAAGFQEERRKREEGREVPGADDEENGDAAEVPENDLVRETRQVLIRGALLPLRRSARCTSSAGDSRRGWPYRPQSFLQLPPSSRTPTLRFFVRRNPPDGASSSFACSDGCVRCGSRSALSR